MKKIFVCLAILTLAACAHHDDVRPSEDGVHRVIFNTDNKDDGARDGLKQANHYCAEENKRAVVVSEASKYSGTMEEGTYRNSKTAAKVAQGIGGAAWVFGGKNESNAGGIVGLGGDRKSVV